MAHASDSRSGVTAPVQHLCTKHLACNMIKRNSKIVIIPPEEWQDAIILSWSSGVPGACL